MSGDVASEIARRLEREAKRTTRARQTLRILERAGLTYRANDRGGVVIEHRGRAVDVWPQSGKWAIRGGGCYRGVFSLLKLLGLNSVDPADEPAHAIRERRIAICKRCGAEIIWLAQLTGGKRVAVDRETVAPGDAAFDPSAHSPHVLRCAAK